MASQASLSSQAAIYMHTINLLEVHYGFYRALGREKSGVILENVNVMPIKFIDSIDAVIFSEASRLKAKYAIPLGDCIGLATTVKMNGVFVTSDHHELEAVEKNETVKFFWFR